MNDPKPKKARKRPSARRAPEASGPKAAPAGGSKPRKRVAARRGASEAADERPTGARRVEGGKPRAQKGRAKKSSRSEPRTDAVQPRTAVRSASGPTHPERRAASDPPPSAPELGVAASSVSSEGERRSPSIAPPGELIGDEVWETVAEGTGGVDALGGEPSSGRASEPAGAGGRAPRVPSNLTRHSQVAGPRQRDALGSARAVLGSDYYFEQWGREGLRRQELDVDDFGLDPHYEQRVRPWLTKFAQRYFRLGVEGIENLPADGRALLVANRSGVVPWDGLVLKEALRGAAPSLPALRWLSEDSVFYYPFLGVFMNRMGAVRACPENAERLLAQSRLVAVFPEGARGAGKLFRDRYRLERFGRGGYVRLALRNEVPVLPVAIVGGEDAYPMLARSKLLGMLLGTRYAPVTPTFPALGPMGLLPAPAKWRIRIGEPLALDEHGPAAANDSLVVHRVNEQVRRTLQALLDRTVRERGRPFV